jgi:predicted RNA-binding Zn-ribbon protein involved in translation (DUF1610 family)
MEIVCPNCGSIRVKRSRTKGLRERVMKYFNIKAHLCLDCGWRGLHYVKKIKGTGGWKIWKRQKLSWTAIIVASLLLALALVMYMMREPGPLSREQDSFFSHPARNGPALAGRERIAGEGPVPM